MVQSVLNGSQLYGRAQASGGIASIRNQPPRNPLSCRSVVKAQSPASDSDGLPPGKNQSAPVRSGVAKGRA